jgi:hypothetical protein
MLREGLRKMGCEVLGAGHIVPWYIGDDAEVENIAHQLEEAGIFASPIRFPAVAKGEALIRFMLMASHTEDHIERTLTACSQATTDHKREDGRMPLPCEVAARVGIQTTNAATSWASSNAWTRHDRAKLTICRAFGRRLDH